MKIEYERKIADLRLELTTALSSEGNATVRIVTGLFETVTNNIDQHTVDLNTVESRMTTVKEDISAMGNDLTGIMQNVARGPVMNTNHNADAASTARDLLTASTRESAGEQNSHALLALEARIDNMEDQSRRDNLLFYSINEQKGENCEAVIRELMGATIFKDNKADADKIEVVRAHRLGKYDSTKNRPIIVKFLRYKDKMHILFNSKKLQEKGSSVSEDFSANTNKARKYLQDCIKVARGHWSQPPKKAVVNYKTIFVRDQQDKVYNFPLGYVKSHVASWWMPVERK